MKKIIFGLLALILGILVTIIIISKNKHISLEEIFYSIPCIDTYDSTKNQRMHFEVFTNSKNHLISYVDKNQYFLVDGENQYLLNHVEVSYEEDSTFQNELFYKYMIESDLLEKTDGTMTFKDYKLLIENEKSSVTFQMGDLEIYNQSYSPLEFNDLYGNYAYINNELHLIGITIQLNPTYKVLKKVSLGSAFGSLEAIEQDTLHDSECLESSLKHSVISQNREEKKYYLTAKENYYFIPIAYPELRLITEGILFFQLDDEMYSLEKFTYLANEIHLNQYQMSMKEGKVEYAAI